MGFGFTGLDIQDVELVVFEAEPLKRGRFQGLGYEHHDLLVEGAFDRLRVLLRQDDLFHLRVPARYVD